MPLDALQIIIIVLMFLSFVFAVACVFDRPGLWLGVFIFCLFCLVLLVIADFASPSAAENSAPAPPVVAEKPVAACPAEFNIDDSAWALNRIEITEKKIADDLLVIEHIRILSHMWLPKCAARLYSYGSLGDSDGKRIFAITKSPIGITAFLLVEKGWVSGDNIETFVTDCNETGCNLTFVLYWNKEPVASRTMFIYQYHPFSFEEPVE